MRVAIYRYQADGMENLIKPMLKSDILGKLLAHNNIPRYLCLGKQEQKQCFFHKIQQLSFYLLILPLKRKALF